MSSPTESRHLSNSNVVAQNNAFVEPQTDILTSRLPVEVVCYIFELYVHKDELDIHDNYDFSILSHNRDERPRFFDAVHRSVPLRLGRICRRWRALSWSHHPIWSSLFVILPIPHLEDTPGMVMQWLQRAGSLPLDIRVDGDEGQTYAFPEREDMIKPCGMDIMQVLNQFSAQWRCLDVSGVPLDVVASLDDSLYDKSRLRYLSVGGNYEDTFLDYPWSRVLFKSPNTKHQLTHLSITTHLMHSRINMDWSRLTELHLSNMSRQYAFEAIEYASKWSPLTGLYLQIITDTEGIDVENDQGWKPSYTITIPRLTFLSLHEYIQEDNFSIFLFGHISMPKLKHMYLNGLLASDYTFQEDLYVAFLRRSNCAITHLSIKDYDIPEEMLVRILREIPTIEKLELGLPLKHRYPLKIFECLAEPIDEGAEQKAFLPALSNLSVEAMFPPDWSHLFRLFGVPDDMPTPAPDVPLSTGKLPLCGTSPSPFTPSRSNLHINLSILPDYANTERDWLMSEEELKKFIWLWQTRGIFVVFDLPLFPSAKCLVESYKVPLYLAGMAEDMDGENGLLTF